MSLLTKIIGGRGAGVIYREMERQARIYRQMDRHGRIWTDMDGYKTERQQGDLISLFYVFKIRKID
jgi:hypothetical protein